MIYFLIGTESESKDRKITELKGKLFAAPDALQFDYEVLYGRALEPDALKKALIALPAVAQRRLVVVRESERLTEHHTRIITEALQRADIPCTVVLDYYEGPTDKSFIAQCGRSAQVIRCGAGEAPTVFALARAITTRRQVEALKTLKTLISNGDHPLRIIGGLLWSWRKSRGKLPREKFKSGLVAFKEADINIKRSRLKADHAIELLVVKLCSL